jgi:hypothetical protein
MLAERDVFGRFVFYRSGCAQFAPNKSAVELSNARGPDIRSKTSRIVSTRKHHLATAQARRVSPE